MNENTNMSLDRDPEQKEGSEEEQIRLSRGLLNKVEAKSQGEKFLVHAFETTLIFFRLLNQSMLNLGYTRTQRRQVWYELVRRNEVSNDVTKSTLEVLNPIFNEAEKKKEKKR